MIINRYLLREILGPFAVVRYSSPAVEVTFVQETATSVATVSGRYRTARGVTVGTSSAVLRHAYGSALRCGNFQICTVGTALPGTTFYAATKAEVLILTRRFAMELGRSGITVNAVCPGWIVTDMARRGASEEAFTQRVASMRERTMVGRVGAPEDIAAAVAFLVEPDAGFVTAQVLTVDGGRMDYIGHG